jgi:diguanylate cyclase (GGDEF)-like protein/PAS domain S-box-containing protein
MTWGDQPAIGSPRTANVLIVDDQEENLVALEAVLAPLGHRLVRASSGTEALKQLLRDEFAVVLIDVEMPGIDGFETARLIKQRAKTGDLPIIFITGVSTDQSDIFRGYGAGAVDYVLKPIDAEIVRSKVRFFVDLHLKETALHESEERFRRAFDDAPIGIGLVGIDGAWLRVNRALCEISGYSEAALLAQHFTDLIHPNDQPGAAHHLRELLSGKATSCKLEQRHCHADGHFIWVVVSLSVVRDTGGRALYLIAQFEDVTERKRAESQLTHQALHDSLTGLANRALFLDRVELALNRVQRSGSSAAVLFLDIDRFKVVNDSLGHDRGDELLRAVGERLRELLRPIDTIARIGGDEFTILCEETGERDAVAVAQRILDALAEPFEVGGADVFVTASIGIVLSSNASADPGHLISDADAAMYRAKENGKARYELFDDRMRDRAMQRMATENALHRALDRGEFRLFYQPEVDLDTGAVRGVEALLRWDHPQRGLILPAEFVPLAEETGLIVPIGRWALEGACRQARRWQRECPGAVPQVSVNLSGRQFAQPDLIDFLSRALEQARLEPALLCLEVTETVLLRDSEQTLTILAAMRGLGVRIGIDDFGTGYSSLSYLKRFAVDVLKIDKAFIDGLGSDAQDSSILAAVARLAQALNLTAVAEGVETAQQLRVLRRLGFKSAQGFYFAAPQPADEIRKLLRSPDALGNGRHRGVAPTAKLQPERGTSLTQSA